MNVTITPNVTPTFTLTDTYCIGDMAAVLTTTSDNGITGTWSPTTINTSAATTSTFTFTPDGSGCGTNFTIQIPVNDCDCSNPSAKLTPTSVSCDSPNSGSILVTNVVGGVAPYLYSIDNGNTFTENNNFNNLSAGAYEIIVQSINGCESLTTAIVNDAIPVEVDLGSNTTLNLGQSVDLNTSVNIPLSKIDTIIWTPSDNLSCENCLTPTATPTNSITYEVLVVDTIGCEGEASISIIVDRRLRVYAPSAFSPNGDGYNDRFTIFSDEHVQEIEELKIFNRWSNIVYIGKNLQPNDLSSGWDGTHRGNFLDPDTFLFFAKLKMEDGRTEIITGEVSLTR